MDRRLGLVSAFGVALLGVAYLVCLAFGLASLASPEDPIADPWFTALEILILAMMPLMVTLMVSVHAWSAAETKVHGLTAVVFMAMVAAITSAVHFGILTLARHEAFEDLSWLFAFSWPSVVYALDILAWDVFFPLAVLFAAPVFAGGGLEAWIRISLRVSGVLALAGLVVGDMGVRNVGIVGYAVVFPVAAASMGVLFRRMPVGGAGPRRGMMLALIASWAVVAGCGTGEGADGERVLGVHADTVAVLGVLGAADGPSFGEVTAVGFDARGRLHVLDATAGRVTVVDSTGAVVGTLGSPGEGPGELRFPSAMAVLPDGRVAIFDAGARGFVVFGADGSYEGTAAVDADRTPLPPPGSLGVLSSGRVVGSTTSPPEPGDPHSGGPRELIAYGVDPGVPHVVLAEAWRPPLPETREPGPELTGGFRVRLSPVVGFHPGLLVAPLPGDLVAVVDSTAWVVRLLDGEGRLVRTLRRAVEPIPVTPRLEAAERRRRFDAALADPPRVLLTNSEGGTRSPADAMVRAFVEARVDGMGFHPVVPVVERLGADHAGRIWVGRSGPAPGEPGPIDVVDADGTHHGTLPPGGLAMPDAFGPDGLAAWIGADPLGTPLVHLGRVRITPPSTSGSRRSSTRLPPPGSRSRRGDARSA